MATQLNLKPAKTSVIFEMANNHQGSVDHGKRIIEEMGGLAKVFNFRGYMKFQMRNLETYLRDPKGDDSYTKRFRDTSLSQDDYQTLFQHAEEHGLEVMVTAFDEDSLFNIVENFPNVKNLKIASATAKNDPRFLGFLYDYLKDSQDVLVDRFHVFASTGGMTYSEIDLLLHHYLSKFRNVTLLHCIGSYPVSHEDVHLNVIEEMVDRYAIDSPNRRVSIGYSGHENPRAHYISESAVVEGASVVERHVGIPTLEHPLNAYSLSPPEVAEWLISIREQETALGDKDRKGWNSEENAKLETLSREYECVQAFPRAISFANITDVDTNYSVDAVFPPTKPVVSILQWATDQTMPNFSPGDVIIPERKNDIRVYGQPILRDSEEVVDYINRFVVSRLQSLHIIPEDLSGFYPIHLELSHHYGMKNFYQTGAWIMNLINEPEYSKKLVVLLPGQSHPKHHHPNKKETFFILSGVLQLELGGDDSPTILYTGNQKTIPINKSHAFVNVGGDVVVIEEIATHAYREGSVYEDSQIQELGIEERKTVIQSRGSSLGSILYE